MAHPASDMRVDRILLEGIRNPAGRWILATNSLVLGLYLVSPWGLGEVLVAFWLEAVVVAFLFAGFLALAPDSGPSLLHRLGRVALWLVLAAAFLALTGAGVSWLAMGEGLRAGQDLTESPADPPLLPPVGAALGAAPWMAVAWIVLRSAAPFSDVFSPRRRKLGVGLAAGRFFGVYLPVLAATAALYALAGDAFARFVPVFFLAVLTYYESVLTLRLLPLVEEGG